MLRIGPPGEAVWELNKIEMIIDGEAQHTRPRASNLEYCKEEGRTLRAPKQLRTGSEGKRLYKLDRLLGRVC